ncbi:signal peptidase II [Bacteriovorax sp. PP10]|uniref:Signal peptidase II n=1 Tax=Bacteriovorax antarcticus TaxID=3088717 RepID=A0ABU5VZ86_9BACT|nr:signal peptidase II [Bacteriovorax sp. PP10]MEA9356895.1 signal peptidase II [Bacteriovorax sp. PP10]
MFKKGIILSLVLFLLALAIDFIWKMKMAGELSHINKGFIFGTLQDLPASLTLVTLSSMGGLLFFIYIIFIIMLSPQLNMLKAGLGLLVGGIIGNVIDRAIHGGTLDFLPMKLPLLPPIVFNPADVFQWIGAAIIAYKIITKDNIIWYPENQRGFSLVNAKEQMKFALKFAAISLCTCLVLGLFALSYLTLTLQSANIASRSPAIGFAISYLAITLFFTTISFFAGLILSQRTAGPLYAFEKYVEDLLKGDKRDLKLREGDNYRHLEKIADDLKNHFHK